MRAHTTDFLRHARNARAKSRPQRLSKRPLVLIALAVAIVMATELPTVLQANIRGSGHDFSARNWNVTGESCVVCHPPGTVRATGTVPAWNHDLTRAVFTTYHSETMQARVGQPTSVSRLCLSCHDGTVAVNSFAGNTGSEFIQGTALLGADLSRAHPVSFTYDATLAAADRGLFNPATKTVPALGGKTVQQAMLVGDRLECSSCHDVHKTRGDSAGDQYALVVKNDHSGLCFTCHNK